MLLTLNYSITYRCLTGNLSTLFFLSLDKCVLVPLLEDHIICDCAGILQEKKSTFKLQFTISTREEKNALPQHMNANVFPVGAR